MVMSVLVMQCVKRYARTEANFHQPEGEAQQIKSPVQETSIDRSAFVKLATSDSIHLLLASRVRSEIIYPGDNLEVTVYEKLPVSQEKRTELKRVNGEGIILLVPLGEVAVVGLTVAEARKLIEEKLSAFIREPFCEISVVAREYEPKVYVFGEVAKTGAIPLNRGDRLLNVISTIGGCKSDAYRRSIKIIRNTVDNRVTMYSVNLLDIIENGKTEYNVVLQDQDIIYVPRRFLTNFNEVMSVLGGLMPWYLFFGNLK
ncbi:MAG: polysaccharide biosynthesis/export family protein [Chitinivibrionales bacterium]|nr:polysaccharide biosynthesis/export family protein [Chitinivibrionales bacterium]